MSVFTQGVCPFPSGVTFGFEGACFFLGFLGPQKGLTPEDPRDCFGTEEGGVPENGVATEKGSRKWTPFSCFAIIENMVKMLGHL